MPHLFRKIAMEFTGEAYIGFIGQGKLFSLKIFLWGKIS